MAAFDESESPQDRLLLQAEEYMRQGRYDDAVGCYEELRKITPEDLWAHLGYASALEMAGEVGAAQQVVERVGNVHPSSPHLHRFLRLFYERREDRRRAQMCREALRVLEDMPDDMPDQLADLYFNQGRYHEAAAELERVLQDERLDDDQVRASVHARLGACHRQMGNLQEAREQLLTALAFVPGNHWALAELADAERSLGNAERARHHYRAALASNPDDHWTRGHLAQLEYEQGENTTAQDLYRTILEDDPSCVWALVEMSQVVFEDDPNHAQELCLRAIDIDSGYPWAYTQLANIERSRGDYEGARKHYQQALSMLPGATWVLIELADCCRLVGHHEEALTHLEHARNAAPFDAAAHAFTASVLRDLERLDEAAAFLDKAVELDADYLWAWRELTEVNAIRGAHEQAAEALRQAIDIAPDDPINDGLQAFLLRQKDELEDALPCLRRAVDRDPDYEWATRELAEVLLQLGRLEEAEAAANAAIERNPHPHLLALLAEIQRRSGKRAEALGTLEKLIASEPDHAHGIALSAELLLPDDAESALQLARRACELSPEHPEFRLLLIQCLLHNGALEEARPLLARVVKECPVTAPAAEMAADLAIHDRDFNAAAEALELGLRDHPEHPRLLLARTRLAIQQEEPDPTGRLRALLEADVDLPWSEVALCFQRAGDAPSFRRASDRALERIDRRGSDQHVRALQQRVEGELGFRDPPAARRFTEDLVTLAPDNVHGRLFAAMQDEQSGATDRAIDHLQHVRNLMPADHPWQQRRQVDLHVVRLLEEQNRVEDADDIWLELHQQYGSESEVRCERARWLLRREDPAGPAAIDEVLEQEPVESRWWQRALHERALQQFQRGEHATALATLEAHRDELKPANQRLLCLLLLGAGRLDEALAEAERLVEAAADDEVADEDRRLVLVRVLLARGDFRRAETMAADLPASEEQAVSRAEAQAGQRKLAEALALIRDCDGQPGAERLLTGAALLLELHDEAAAFAWLGQADPEQIDGPFARVLRAAWPAAWGEPPTSFDRDDLAAVPSYPQACRRIAEALLRRGEALAAAALLLRAADLNVHEDRPRTAAELRRDAITPLLRAGERRHAWLVAWRLRSPWLLWRCLIGR